MTGPDGKLIPAADTYSNYGLPACSGNIKSQCVGPQGKIELNSGEQLKLTGGARPVILRSVSTSTKPAEQFSVAGSLTEFDGDSTGLVPSGVATFPDLSAKRANETDPASLTVAGADLKQGTHVVSFGQGEVPCKIKSDGGGLMNLTVQLSYTVG